MKPLFYIIVFLVFGPSTYSGELYYFPIQKRSCLSLLGAKPTHQTAEIILFEKSEIPSYQSHFEFVRGLEGVFSLYTFISEQGTLSDQRPLFSKRDKGYWTSLNHQEIEFWGEMYLIALKIGPRTIDFRDHQPNLPISSYTRLNFSKIEIALSEVLKLFSQLESSTVPRMTLKKKLNLLTASNQKSRMLSILDSWEPQSDRLIEFQRLLYHEIGNPSFNWDNRQESEEIFYKLLKELSKNFRHQKKFNDKIWSLSKMLEKLRVI